MDLQHKIGPLPLWAWIGIAAVLGYVIIEKRKQAASAASVATVPSGASTEMSGIGTAATPAGSTTGFNSLGDWQASAASGAIGAGYNPSATETALANYASGQPLDPTQEGILNWILQNYGAPPGGAQPVIAATLPPPQAQPGSSESQTTNNPNALTGYTQVPNAQDLSVLRAENETIYGNIAGQPVAVLQGATPLPTFAPYQKTSGGNPPFYVKTG